MPELVTSPEQITPDWLTRTLRESGALGDGTVAELDHRRIGAGRLGATYLLTPGYRDAPETAPTSVVAKVPTTDAGGRAWAASLDCYRREVAFYTEVAAGLEIRTPVPAQQHRRVHRRCRRLGRDRALARGRRHVHHDASRHAAHIEDHDSFALLED